MTSALTCVPSAQIGLISLTKFQGGDQGHDRTYVYLLHAKILAALQSKPLSHNAVQHPTGSQRAKKIHWRRIERRSQAYFSWKA